MKLRTFLFWLCGAAGAALAQDDVFAFMPEGGRTLLAGILEEYPDLTCQFAASRPADEWLAMMTGGSLACVATLDDWQRQTLADYLAYVDGAVGKPEDLPWDGRDMTLLRCQSCHIVTVVVTQARTREAWLGTMNKPSHIEVPLSEAERSQLADYLVINAGLPIDVIPPELRAGGASY